MQNKLKIIYVGVRHENYDPKRRDSFEYVNFYLTFKGMSGVEVIERPFDGILEVGKKKFNEELLEVVRREKPDLLFVFMYTDELDPATLLRIKNETTTKSVAWFADDYWRFWNYAKHWPPYFTYVVTTYSKAVEWYKAAGYGNVILSQWACNTALYKPVDVVPLSLRATSGSAAIPRDSSPAARNDAFVARDIDVSFVGQHKSGRARIVKALRAAGINVRCFGFGWPEGKVSYDEMLNVFGRSKICLNLTDRKNIWDPSVLGRLFFKKSVNRVVPDFHLADNFCAYLHFPIPHTHARPFELAGCRAFVISGRSEDVGKYYSENKEMVFYDDVADLTPKIRYYLAHDAEREMIAKNGYERTLAEHTYEKRFRELFSKIGL